MCCLIINSCLSNNIILYFINLLLLYSTSIYLEHSIYIYIYIYNIYTLCIVIIDTFVYL